MKKNDCIVFLLELNIAFEQCGSLKQVRNDFTEITVAVLVAF